LPLFFSAPSLFSEFLGSNDKGNGGGQLEEGTLSPPNGRHGPVARLGGATDPFFFSPETSLQI